MGVATEKRAGNMFTSSVNSVRSKQFRRIGIVIALVDITFCAAKETRNLIA